MANAVRGEVVLEVGEAHYTLVLDFNALCALEEVLDKSVGEIVVGLKGAVRGSLMRAVLWGALQRHHPEITLEAAGDMIPEAGLDNVLTKLWEAVNAAFPRKAEGDANAPEDPPKTKAKRPTRSPAGTGTATSSPGSSST